MNFTTSNYRAARSVFGLAELILWCGFGLGIILAIIAAGAASNGFGSPGILAAAPGAALSVICFIGVVIVQMGKASVDSADFAYQTLAIAREQLAISKQALKQDAKAQSFADRPPVAVGENHSRAEAPGSASYATPPAPPEPEDTALDWDYRDTRIHRTQEGYLVEGQVFETRELAKNFVDGEALRASLASPT